MKQQLTKSSNIYRSTICHWLVKSGESNESVMMCKCKTMECQNGTQLGQETPASQECAWMYVWAWVQPCTDNRLAKQQINHASNCQIWSLRLSHSTDKNKSSHSNCALQQWSLLHFPCWNQCREAAFLVCFYQPHCCLWQTNGLAHKHNCRLIVAQWREWFAGCCCFYTKTRLFCIEQFKSGLCYSSRSSRHHHCSLQLAATLVAVYGLFEDSW